MVADFLIKPFHFVADLRQEIRIVTARYASSHHADLVDGSVDTCSLRRHTLLFFAPAKHGNNAVIAVLRINVGH